jgi:hypothetical protein
MSVMDYTIWQACAGLLLLNALSLTHATRSAWSATRFTSLFFLPLLYQINALPFVQVYPSKPASQAHAGRQKPLLCESIPFLSQEAAEQAAYTIKKH